MSRDEDLIAAYLDDAITEEQTAELQAWLKADAANVRQFVLANAREDLLRRAVKSSATLRAVTEHRSPRSGFSRWTFRSNAILKCTAAVILATVVTWIAMQRADPETQVTLVQMSGPVSWRNENGGNVEHLKIDAKVSMGTLVVEGEGSRGKFAFADGSTFELSGGSELTLGDGTGKQMFLRRGTLLASVSRQPAGRPLRIQTPTAEAVVLGTTFAMNAGETETFLRVNSGEVELRRLADNQALSVSVHEQARAGVTATQPMLSEPVTPLPGQWHATRMTPRVASWLGEWRTPEALVAVPRVVFVNESGVEEKHYHAGASSDFPGLVTLREDSAVRVRYRIQRPLNLGLFISTHTESGVFSGNFQAYVEERKTPADSDGWRTATVPITSFKPLRWGPLPFQPDCVVEVIFATTYADDVGLEVAELEVISKGDK